MTTLNSTYSPILQYFAAIKKIRGLSSSYLLVGSSAAEDFACAVKIAALKYCQSASLPCAGCEACASFESGSNFDVFRLCEEDQIKIEQVRQIQDFLRLRSRASAGKTVLVSQIDRLTEEASNAFLKTLEEPPAACLIIATTTRKDRVLPTIDSRCKKIYVSGEQAGGLAEPEPDARTLETLFSAGATALKDKDRDSAINLVRWLLVFYRDVMVYCSTGKKEHLIDTRNYEIIVRYSSGCTVQKAMANLERLLLLQADLENINVNLARSIINTIVCPKSS